MNNQTIAVLHITAPNGQEFVDKGAIVNQTKGLNGVCVEVYLPTKAIEAQKPMAIDKIMKLVDDYGHAYAFVGDNRMPLARKAVLDALQSVQNTVDPDSLQDLIAQAEADKKAYPLTWTYGWEMTTLYNDTGRWIRVGEVNKDGRKYRRLLHATNIMQCEQDKIDYPEFWYELWQYKTSRNTSFNTFSKEGCDYNFWQESQYRQHPHRENIIKFHACSEDDKKRWEHKIKSMPCSSWSIHIGEPKWKEDHEYRLRPRPRPRVCFITLQDGTKMEFPEPVREALNFGDVYWYVYPSGEVSSHTWINDSDICKKALEIGLIHLTQQAAEQHLSALQAMNAQVAV